ncbi:hypothetical protein ARMSODRAFT_981034 [Armillaria solidipes]|uniref:Uncharacterized protein n=1 Tax=Armillaria solidipes TaxID=1076256 RepID=A0A2H3B7N1_9AGAR|nr:hypothetical protein ARMSODRAFT_981034 [Armillaria solidipes]
MPARTRFEKQRVVVVIAVIEVETLFFLHEPLLRQRDDFPRRQRRNNIMSDLLHEEIVEWETWQEWEPEGDDVGLVIKPCVELNLGLPGDAVFPRSIWRSLKVEWWRRMWRSKQGSAKSKARRLSIRIANIMHAEVSVQHRPRGSKKIAGSSPSAGTHWLERIVRRERRDFNVIHIHQLCMLLDG